MPRPSEPPSTIWHSAALRYMADGSFMLPVPRRMPANEFKSHGSTAPPKKICT